MSARTLDRRTLAALCDRPFGSRLTLVAIIPHVGRLYVNSWAVLAGRDERYALVGFGHSVALRRAAAAALLRDHRRNLILLGERRRHSHLEKSRV